MAQSAMMLTDEPKVLVPVVFGEIRRFQVPDIDRHPWLIKRFVAAYPHITERMLPGWLRGIIYQNEFLFLYQDHSVALAQAVRPDPFTPDLIVRERFVWAEAPRYVEEAAQFYGRFKLWAKQQSAGRVVVEEQTDVPHEMIQQQLGILLETKLSYARL